MLFLRFLATQDYLSGRKQEKEKDVSKEEGEGEEGKRGSGIIQDPFNLRGKGFLLKLGLIFFLIILEKWFFLFMTGGMPKVNGCSRILRKTCPKIILSFIQQ
jgi:hypothetical protein